MSSDWDFYSVMPSLVEKGIKYIETRPSTSVENPKPWFLLFSFPSPHLPIIPGDKFDGLSDAGPYGDFVLELDDAVGQLISVIERKGFTDNTLVIFTSDNGPESGYPGGAVLSYKRALSYNHLSSGILRGAKRDLFEGGHRVPMILKWPGIYYISVLRT